MLLLKRGGSVIYNGLLGEQSGAMIAYFESVAGVQPISKGYSASSAQNTGCVTGFDQAANMCSRRLYVIKNAR